MPPDLIRDIDLKALADAAAWRQFIRDGVTTYWTQGNNATYLNQILIAAKALNRYSETFPILLNVSAHALDLGAGLFVNGASKKLSNQLAGHWQKRLADSMRVLVAKSPSTPPTVSKVSVGRRAQPLPGAQPGRSDKPTPAPSNQRPTTNTQRPTLSPPRTGKPTPAPKTGIRVIYTPPKPSPQPKLPVRPEASPGNPKTASGTNLPQPQPANPAGKHTAAPSPGTGTQDSPKEPPPIIRRIPGMKVTGTVNLWKNCISILSNENSQDRWEGARLVIEAIYREWQRRNTLILQEGDRFKWPDIDAPGGGGTLPDPAKWLKEGLLSYMGYHVGNTQGVVTSKRRKILTEVFYGPVPPVFPRYYLEEWGAQSSSFRLRKMAETLASFIRNAKRKDSDSLAKAIDQWTDDLEYLYLEYYVGKFHFGWPSTHY